MLTHHALGADDVERIRRAAYDAGIAAARSGAHTQAAEFFTIALEHGGPLTAEDEAELLELLGVGVLPDRPAARRDRRLPTRDADSTGAGRVGGGQREPPLAGGVPVVQRQPRCIAEGHAAEAMTVLDAETDDAEQLVQLGHAFAMQAYLAVQASDLDRAETLIARAREIADRTGDSALTIRVRLIENYGVVLNGDDSGRDEILVDSQLRAEAHRRVVLRRLEQHHLLRRRAATAGRRGRSARHQHSADASNTICRSVGCGRLGSRARLQLMVGEWDDAAADADRVLDAPSAPLARTWPLLIRALVALRRHGAGVGLAQRRVATRVPVRRTDPHVARCGGDRRAVLDTGVSDDRISRVPRTA